MKSQRSYMILGSKTKTVLLLGIISLFVASCAGKRVTVGSICFSDPPSRSMRCRTASNELLIIPWEKSGTMGCYRKEDAELIEKRLVELK